MPALVSCFWPDLAKATLERFRPYLLGLALTIGALGILPLFSIAVAIHPLVKFGLASLISAGALYLTMQWMRRWSLLSGLGKGRFSAWFNFSLGTGAISLLSIWLDTWLRQTASIGFISLPMLAVAAVLAIVAWPLERRLLPHALSHWWRDQVAGRWPRTSTISRIAIGILPAALAILQMFQMVGSRTVPEQQPLAFHETLTAELDENLSVRIEESPDVGQRLFVDRGDDGADPAAIAELDEVSLAEVPVTALRAIDTNRLAIGRLDGSKLLVDVSSDPIQVVRAGPKLQGRVRQVRVDGKTIRWIGDDGAMSVARLGELQASSTPPLDANPNLALASLVRWDTPLGERQPGDIFRDTLANGEACAGCPEMVVLPPGTFTMGSPEDEAGRENDEGPQHRVTISAPFALGRYEVTLAEWDACVAAGGCNHLPEDEGWGRDNRPVINVNFEDIQQYVAWLSRTTGATYRLPSEAEWEYAARAGTMTRYYWGDEIGQNRANCIDCGSEWDNRQTAPVGSFQANAFGLYDMSGNVWETVKDDYHDSYEGAPTDGSAWLSDEEQSLRVYRGGAYDDWPELLRLAQRINGHDSREKYVGFRVARTLTP
ncbi:MAG: formylglycine-generating enzyme family protein [Geminicoccaceae bacterium]